MDKERFGKALGLGAREAGKALMKAADAAMAPDPAATRAAGARVRTGVVEARKTGAGLKRGGKNFGQAVWGPFAKASGTLWLEVTGVFFGLFAVTAGAEIWRRRTVFQSGTPVERQHLWFAVGLFLLFGWFTVSNFIRARQRSRR